MIMKNKLFSIIILTVMIIMLHSIAPRAEKHWVPGMGTYGVSDRTVTCSVCGTTHSAGEGHMCERPDRTPTHSSSSSTSSGYEDTYVPPTTYYPPADYSGGYQGSTNAQTSSSSPDMNKFPSLQKLEKEKKKSNTWTYILVTGAVIAGIYFFRRSRK